MRRSGTLDLLKNENCDYKKNTAITRWRTVAENLEMQCSSTSRHLSRWDKSGKEDTNDLNRADTPFKFGLPHANDHICLKRIPWLSFVSAANDERLYCKLCWRYLNTPSIKQSQKDMATLLQTCISRLKFVCAANDERLHCKLCWSKLNTLRFELHGLGLPFGRNYLS